MSLSYFAPPVRLIVGALLLVAGAGTGVGADAAPPEITAAGSHVRHAQVIRNEKTGKACKEKFIEACKPATTRKCRDVVHQECRMAPDNTCRDKLVTHCRPTPQNVCHNVGGRQHCRVQMKHKCSKRIRRVCDRRLVRKCRPVVRQRCSYMSEPRCRKKRVYDCPS